MTRQQSLKRWLLCALVLMMACAAGVAQQVPNDRPPANVAGKWTFYTKGDDGKTGTHYIEFEQNGGTLTGHFKGPNQSGGLQGTVEMQHIVFETKTRHVFHFNGRVDGDSIKGNCGIMGHHCTFEAVRSQ
jgi:hypothetical protein